jgi:tRNA pseudouridine38-40 synthase
MRRIALLLAYDGAGYSGWQVQTDRKTLQGTLEEALGRISASSGTVVAAGRTDAGVHAAGQVIHFDSESSVPIQKLPIALNTVLPKDIRVLAAKDTSPDFHARYDAREREYRYYLYPSRTVPPWYRFVCLGTDVPLDIDILNGYARCLPGTRDFTTFTAAGDPSRSRIRNCTRASFFVQGSFVVFRISANAFLWRMVRSLLGTILDLTGRQAPESEFPSILEARERSAAGPTAPPTGLFLHEVRYDEPLFR